MIYIKKFLLGCNYWASGSAMFMWTDWDESNIESDFKLLKENGISTVRIFPLWSVFQPITMHRGPAGRDIEYMFGENPMDNYSGVSEIMMTRFKKVLDIAEKNEIDVIVSLLTGWMSSRLFAPPALDGKNHLIDNESIMWQLKFVKYFVSYFKDKNIIIAWDLGNECNEMGRVNTKYDAYVWTSSITNAIKAQDASRPVISGMHSLSSDFAFGSNWNIQSQGEICDIVTTHPYPLFTGFCDVAGLDSMRAVLHSSAESCYYADISQKPCLVEEIGTLGPMIAGRTVTAEYARATMFSSLAHSLNGFLWWCAFDFSEIQNNPYNWVALERELGLFSSNKRSKPIIEEFKRFDQFLRDSSLGILPKRHIDAVCILTPDSDQWTIAYGCFVLAKKAGLDIEFQYTDEKLIESTNYILPSLSGIRGPTTKLINELQKRVSDGSDLFITYNGGFMSCFEELAGIEIQTRRSVVASDTVFYQGIDYTLETKTRLFLKSISATILATDSHGDIAFSKNRYGKGNVYFLKYPIELNCLKKEGEEVEYSFYKELNKTPQKTVTYNNSMIGVTEHPMNENKKLVIAINHACKDLEFSFDLGDEYKISKIFYGNIKTIRQHDAAVFEIEKH